MGDKTAEEIYYDEEGNKIPRYIDRKPNIGGIFRARLLSFGNDTERLKYLINLGFKVRLVQPEDEKPPIIIYGK